MSERPRFSFARASAGEPVLDLLLADNLPRLQAFVRAHMAPELRRRESVHDLVQSVCRTLLAERERFDFRSEAEFRAWLFTSALNKIRQKHRFHHRGQRDLRREQDRPDGASEPGALAAGYSGIARPSELAAAKERIEALEAALDTLEPDHREVIALARLADLPTREAAAVMGRSEAATRMLLGRALTRLAAALRRAGIEP